jgi:hypothetical protein
MIVIVWPFGFPVTNPAISSFACGKRAGFFATSTHPYGLEHYKINYEEKQWVCPKINSSKINSCEKV